MQHAAKLFTDEQKQRINATVAEAEMKTSAEIVPVVASASGRYDRPEDIAGLWLGALGVILVWALVPATDDPNSWAGWGEGWKLIFELIALVVGFVLGAALANWVWPLRRLFTPRKQMREEVLSRARQSFYDNRIHRTAKGTGLAVYISLYERMAAVIADDPVLEQLGQPLIDDLCNQLTTTLHEQGPTEALCQTITTAGDRLAATFPRQPDDLNELPDQLVVID